MPAEMMKQTILQIISVQEHLRETGLAKAEAIKKGDADAVDRLTRQEEPLAEKLRALEQKRTQLVRKDTGKANAAFSEWEKAVLSEKELPEWHALYLKLSRSVLTLKQLNQLNQDLLRQSLQWVRLNLNLLMPGNGPSGYGQPGNAQSGSAGRFSGRIDSRA